MKILNRSTTLTFLKYRFFGWIPQVLVKIQTFDEEFRNNIVTRVQHKRYKKFLNVLLYVLKFKRIGKKERFNQNLKFFQIEKSFQSQARAIANIKKRTLIS